MLFFLALLPILFRVPASAESKPNVPDWVRQAAAERLPAYSADTNAVVLLEEETDTVTAPDQHTEHYRRAVKILRPNGRDEGDLAVWIGHDEKLISIHAWSIDAAGHEYELKDKDFISQSNAYYVMYSDVHKNSAQAPGVGPGATIAFEYEVQRRDYFNELTWSPQEDIPVRQSVLTVQLPSGWELKDFWSGDGTAQASPAGNNAWKWTKSDVPAIEDEPNRPSRAALAGRLTIQLYTSDHPLGTNWAAVAKWADGLFRPQRNTSPEMAAKVQELTLGKTDFNSKVRAITEFVQTEFRYYAIEIGIGGFQPHLASEVFKARYGDCKDKANTLGALLSLAGIQSDPVLIHSIRGVVRPEMPSTHFDHAIIAIELPTDIPADRYPATITLKSGKRYVIFDPTDEWMPFGEVAPELQDSYALVVTGSGGELIKVPTLPPGSNQLVRTAQLRIDPEGTLTGEVTEKLTGDFAEEVRMGSQANDQQQQLQQYERGVARSVNNATLQGLTFGGLKQLNEPIDVRYSISADRYAQHAGPLLIVRPRVIGVKSIGLDSKPRRYPYVLGNTARETDDFELQIPEGYVVDDKPEPVVIDTPFASYKSNIEVSKGKLHYSREYVTKTIQVPAADIGELRAFERRVAADEMAAVVLKKATASAGQ